MEMEPEREVTPVTEQAAVVPAHAFFKEVHTLAAGKLKSQCIPLNHVHARKPQYRLELCSNKTLMSDMNASQYCSYVGHCAVVLQG